MNPRKIELTADDLRRHRARLPRGFGEMADFIGMEAAARLLNRHAGQMLTITKGKTPQGKKSLIPLEQLLGRRAVRRLIEYAGGSRSLYVPFCHTLKIHIRNSRITADFDRLTTGSRPLTAIAAANFLAKKYGIGQRSIFNILKQG